MKIAILGVGAAGDIHSRRWTEMGHDVIHIDPGKPRTEKWFSSLAHVPLADRESVEIWDICAPTEVHRELLQKIYINFPQAKCFVEKPLFAISDRTDNRWIQERIIDGARIIVSRPYSYSQLTAAVVTRAKTDFPEQVPRQITVEFVKNRMADEAAGRFIDHHAGVVGYEWCHLLNILRSVLGQKGYQSYLDSPPSRSHLSYSLATSGYPLTFSEVVECDDVEIRLGASIVGDFSFPETAEFVSELEGNKSGSSIPLIANGSQHRSRIVSVLYENGSLHAKYASVPESWGEQAKANQIWTVRDGIVDGQHLVCDPMGAMLAAAAGELTQQTLSQASFELSAAISDQHRMSNLLSLAKVPHLVGHLS